MPVVRSTFRSFSVWFSLLVSFLFLFVSFAEGWFFLSPSTAKAAPCGTWTNPMASAFNPEAEQKDAHPDQSRVPEGLTLYGPNVDAQGETLPLDCTKPTVIFIHGWSPFGEAATFLEAPVWQTRFNVVLFRWHRLSFAPGIVLPAENRVPIALERLEREVKSLYLKLGGQAYPHEIRVVAHSLGAQLALPLMRGVLAQGLTRPRRLELIDPFLWTDLRRVDSSAGSASGNLNWNLVPSKHYEDLRMVRTMGVKTVVYGSSVQRSFGKTIPEIVPVQAMHEDWLGGSDSIGHIELANWYFQSFQFAPPALFHANGEASQEAFSASLPSERFPTMRVKYVQMPSGLSSPRPVDHVFSSVR